MKLWQRITAFAVTATALLAVGFATAPLASAQGVFDVCKQGGTSGSAVCKANGSNNLSGSNGIIVKVANIFAFVGGVAAVFVMMIGGFMYVTASGDANKAGTGRSTVIYAAVGLVIIVVARAIIGFVVTRFK